MRPTAVFIAHPPPPPPPPPPPRGPQHQTATPLPPWVPHSTGFAPAGATNGTSSTVPWLLYAAQSVGSLGRSTPSVQLGCARVASLGIQTSRFSKRYFLLPSLPPALLRRCRGSAADEKECCSSIVCPGRWLLQSGRRRRRYQAFPIMLSRRSCWGPIESEIQAAVRAVQ